jgi:hypothetical protein
VAGREAALWAAFAFLEMCIVTNVYIDGFNFYYGALKKTPYRWVNVRTLCELLLPKNTVAGIKYFTAPALFARAAHRAWCLDPSRPFPEP